MRSTSLLVFGCERLEVFAVRLCGCGVGDIVSRSVESGDRRGAFIIWLHDSSVPSIAGLRSVSNERRGGTPARRGPDPCPPSARGAVVFASGTPRSGPYTFIPRRPPRRRLGTGTGSARATPPCQSKSGATRRRTCRPHSQHPRTAPYSGHVHRLSRTGSERRSTR